MEFLYDYNIIGEVLIPLENNLTEIDSNGKDIIDEYENLNNIFDQGIKDFRSIIFQNELMRLFLFIKIESVQGIGSHTKLLNIEELFNDVHINLELCPNTEEMESNEEKQRIHFQTELRQENIALIKRKLFIKEQNIIIIEVIRKVMLSNNFLDSWIMLKLDIMKKLPDNYLKQLPLKEIIICEYYTNTDKYSIIKTFFKEVKIVHPFKFTLSKQMSFSPDKSIIQISIENITYSLNFIDQSLKRSKCLNNKKQSEYIGLKNVKFGFPIELKQIEIKYGETRLYKETISIKSLKKILNTMTLSIQNDLPIIIKSGECTNLTLEFNRNEKLYDLLSSSEPIESIKQDGNDDRGSRGSFFSVFSLLKGGNINTKKTIGAKEHEYAKMLTPINISISHNSDLYSSMGICVWMKWRYEYKDSLSIYFCCNEEQLIIDQAFELKMIIKNISLTPININIEINDSFEDIKLDKNMIDIIKTKSSDYLSAFISQQKKYIIGTMRILEEKEIIVRLIPIKTGLVSLPDFMIYDLTSNKKYSIMNTKTLLIKDQ